MAENDISASVASDLTNAITDYSVDTQSVDGTSDLKETRWMNTKWTKYYGYYSTIPELQAVINARARWGIGNGIIAEADTIFILDSIRGNGFDTINTILENMMRTQDIGGDSYAQIIRDEEGNLLNLKPLDPEVIEHIADRNGMIIRFEQKSKIKGNKPRKFKPEEIFYLPRNRVADEIHGTSMTSVLEWIILAKNEAMVDMKQVFHRFVKPRWIIKLDSDKPSVIAAEKAKWDKANEKGENMYIPMGSVEVEQMTISPNSTLNPLSWIESIDNKFYEAANCPKIIVGGTGGITEAAVKIAYLAFEQNIRERQLEMMNQFGIQLGMEIKLEISASLKNELLSDNNKDEENGAVQPNDVTAGVGK